jgi:superfamily II DNA/RNA helicase
MQSAPEDQPAMPDTTNGHPAAGLSPDDFPAADFPADLPLTELTPTQAQPAGITFRELGVAEKICQALADAGIVTAFPIQELALPIALGGQDIIGQARTGTGKTLAFGIPLIERLDGVPGRKPAAPRALVVVPTRELAIQVADDLRTAASRSDVNVVTLYGGRAYEPQIEALATVDIVVGTPGRLLDLARNHLDLSQVSALVLDEADKMLDLGFLPDVERILRLTPSERQTMLFSATMPGEVVTLARRHLRQATHVRAEQHDATSLVPSTEQHVFRAHQMDKAEVLVRVLQAEGRGLTIVFCRTKRTCDQVAVTLTQRGFAAAAVHGDLGQGQRERAMRAFRSGKVDVLVATDVAARGLDVDDVTHVVNYECPEDDMAYLHRIGRTGRAGRAGVVVTFVDWRDMQRWTLINDALSLGHPDPPETYSTSEHLFAELGIPPTAGAVLPRALRGRLGLQAEDLEDIGETGRIRSSAARGTAADGRGNGSRSDGGAPGGGRSDGGGRRGRGESGRGADGHGRAGGAADNAGSPDRDAGRRGRIRRRTRSGTPIPAGEAGQAAGPVTPSARTASAHAAPPGEGQQTTTTRRRRGQRGRKPRGAGQPGAASGVGAAAPDPARAAGSAGPAAR